MFTGVTEKVTGNQQLWSLQSKIVSAMLFYTQEFAGHVQSYIFGTIGHHYPGLQERMIHLENSAYFTVCPW